MFHDLHTPASVLLLVALTPAGLRWWRGRRLERLVGDAAFPERLMASERRHGAVFGVVLVLLFALSARSLVWTIPLCIVARLASVYPLRRVLFEETWSIGAFVWFFIRLWVAIVGIWIGLAFLPLLAWLSGSFDWAVGAAIGIALLLWSERYAQVVRFALHARPIEDAALLPRFRSMAHRCGIALPQFELVELHGGSVANAIALPSLRGSAVIFSDVLLERLDADEVVAICAHELAHLEHFNPQYLRRLRTATSLLIVLGAAIGPIVRVMGLSSSILPWLLWAGALVGFMAWRARDRQRNETASDLRGIALCGDAEALVRGLTKLYTFARVPRRFPVELERASSHPSLARRIRDIRAAAGAAPASLDTAASFAATDGRTTVTFQNDRLQWIDGDVATHALNYAYLSELRLHARSAAKTSLVAIEQGGRRWEATLAPTDVARAQAVLDIVDGRLASPPAPQSAWPAISRIALAVVVALGAALGQVAVAVVTLFACVLPAPPLLAATAMASLTGAGLTLRETPLTACYTELSLVLAAFGVGLLIAARGTRGDAVPRRAGLLTGSLAVLSLLGLLALLLDGTDLVRIHGAARSSPAAVLLLALCGALACWRTRLTRYASIAVAAAGLAVIAIGSPAFLDRFAHDPFLVSAQPLVEKTITTPRMSEFSIPVAPSQLVLSPAGKSVAFTTGGYDDERSTHTFQVGRAGGTLVPLVAEQIAFLDDDRLLATLPGDDGVSIREIAVDAPTSILWEQRVEDVDEVELTVDRATKRWRILGWDSERGVVRGEGAIGMTGVDEMRWAADRTQGGWPTAVTTSAHEALIVEVEYQPGLLSQGNLRYWASLLRPMSARTRFVGLSARGRTDLGVSSLHTECVGAPLGDERLVCAAFDATRTRFIALDPSTRGVAAIAWVPGRFFTDGGTDGWLSGWIDGSAVAVHLPTREMFRVSGDGHERVIRVVATDQVIATMSYTGRGAMVRTYAHE